MNHTHPSLGLPDTPWMKRRAKQESQPRAVQSCLKVRSRVLCSFKFSASHSTFSWISLRHHELLPADGVSESNGSLSHWFWWVLASWWHADPAVKVQHLQQSTTAFCGSDVAHHRSSREEGGGRLPVRTVSFATATTCACYSYGMYVFRCCFQHSAGAVWAGKEQSVWYWTQVGTTARLCVVFCWHQLTTVIPSVNLFSLCKRSLWVLAGDITTDGLQFRRKISNSGYACVCVYGSLWIWLIHMNTSKQLHRGLQNDWIGLLKLNTCTGHLWLSIWSKIACQLVWTQASLLWLCEELLAVSGSACGRMQAAFDLTFSLESVARSYRHKLLVT